MDYTFSASSPLQGLIKGMSNHQTFYCTVHVYVVHSFIFVLVCGLFEWQKITAGFYSVFISTLQLEIQLLREKGLVPINQFNSATCLCLSQARICISNVKCWRSFYIQWFEEIVHCLFCWYWWNWWPSLFKLSLFCWYWWNWWPSLFKLSFVLFILVELMTITV